MAEERSVISQVIENVVIIDKIIKFSNFDDLKSLRQINSLWKEIVSRKLFQKSVTILRTKRKSINALKHFANTTNNMTQGIRELQIIADVNHWIELREEESQIWNKILENISIQVEKLMLSPRNFFNRNTTYFIPKSDIKFPNVFQLDLENHVLDIVQIYPDFYSKFPNLKELIVSRLSDPGFVLSPLINIEDGSRLLSLAPNLKSLTIKSPMSLRCLQLLVNFPQEWSKLDLSLPMDLNDRSLIAAKLEQLLEQNKSSLICLKLRDYINVPKTNLQLPKCFPHLKELEFVFPEVNYYMQPINYSNMFPSLNTYFVYIRYGRISIESPVETWKIFFPKQVCNSLRIIKMGHSNSANLVNNRLDSEWHLKMFPNARVVLTL